MVSRRSRGWFAAAALIMTSSNARADAIDGDWCYATQNLNIQGQRIRTPEGTEARHDRRDAVAQRRNDVPDTNSGAIVKCGNLETL